MSDHQPVTLVILGASGDLTHRLLLPGLGTLLRARPALDVTLVGAAFDDLDDATWRERVREALAEGGCRTEHAGQHGQPGSDEKNGVREPGIVHKHEGKYPYQGVHADLGE